MTSFKPAHAAVWFEIPVTDLDRSKRFYETVLKTELKLEDGGPNMMAVFPGGDEQSVRGHLYPGKPAASGTGNTIHLAVGAPIEAAMERVTSAGGTVVSPAIQIPAGTFAYCLDPDGNSFGLFV